MAGTTNYYGISYPTSTDYVKDGASAIQTVATGFDSAVAIPTYNAQTGATYTFVLADTGKTVTASNASAQTYTIPPTASVAWTANTTLRVLNLGAGVVTFAAGAGVTVTNTAQTLAQYQSANLVRTGLNAWTVTPASGLSGGGLTLINSTTFSGVSSQSVSDVFSATYQNYRIMIQSVNASGAAFNMRLRVSGADSTASNYSGAYYYRVMGGAGSGTTGSGPTTSWSLNGETTQKSDNVSMDIFRPFEATYTYTNFFNNSEEGASTYDMLQGGNIFNAATSFTGFTIFPASSTISGTVRTYGYNNS